MAEIRSVSATSYSQIKVVNPGEKDPRTATVLHLHTVVLTLYIIMRSVNVLLVTFRNVLP